MRRTVAKMSGVLGALLIGAVVLLCLPLTAPRVLGYDVYAIVSGSMEPSISTGSLVYAKQTEPAAVEPGDVIVFLGGQDGGTVITHRVVENQTQARAFITKGDANAANDVYPVPYEHCMGRVALSVPALGYFLPAVSTMQGKLSLLGVLAGAVVLRALGAWLGREKP